MKNKISTTVHYSLPPRFSQIKVVYFNQLHDKFRGEELSVDQYTVHFILKFYCKCLLYEFCDQSGITPDKICIYHGVALICQYDMYVTGNMSNLRVDTCLFWLQFKQSVN